MVELNRRRNRLSVLLWPRAGRRVVSTAGAQPRRLALMRAVDCGVVSARAAKTASCSVSGATSAPLGHTTVPPSRKKRREDAGRFNGSNTGPFSHTRKSTVPSVRR